MWISLFTLKCLEQRPSHPARTLCPKKGGFVWPQNSGWLGQWHHPGGCTSRPCTARNSIHFFFVTHACETLLSSSTTTVYPAPLRLWEEAHTHLWLFHWVKSWQEKLIQTNPIKWHQVQDHWCYEGHQFAPAGAFLKKVTRKRVISIFIKVLSIEWTWYFCDLTNVVWMFYVMWRQPVCHRSLLCVSAVTTAVVNTLRSAACQGMLQRCKHNTSPLLKFSNLWLFSCPSDFTTPQEERKKINQSHKIVAINGCPC